MRIFYSLQKIISLSILSFIIILFSLQAKGQMRQIYLDNVANNEIYKTSFYTASTGYVAFRDWVGYTTDSGYNFIKKYITTSNVNYNGNSVNLTFGFGIRGVHAFNQNRIIVYGDYGLVPSILLSTDGGNTFSLVYHSQYNAFQLSTGIEDLVFAGNGSTGFAVDADRILRSTNQGSTWAVVYVDPLRFFNKVEAADANNLVAMSTEYTTNRAYKSSNGGNSFIQLSTPLAATGKINSCYFISGTTGWLNMEDDNSLYYTYRTTNAGTTWVLMNNPNITPFATEKMRFFDSNNGFALSDQNKVYKTTDGGVIWEPFARNNSYTYLGYTHNDLQCFSLTQLWAGGGHGFLELNTNANGQPLPRAFFKIDTIGLYNTNIVSLQNFSKTTYTYRWLLNGTQINTSYNCTYVHDVNRTTDTISLIVNNGTVSDTSVKYQYFYPPVKVFSFTPTVAGTSNVVTIAGLNFTGATSVSFGGVQASSFTVLSNTSISAVVSVGATGLVKVLTASGRDSLAGFTFLPPPTLSSCIPLSATAGTTITITGTNFTGTTGVSFGGIAATMYTVVNATTITALAPSGNSGTITVITPGGTASLNGYIAIPTITSFTPTQGTQGSVITLFGTSFTSISSVSFGGVNVQSFIVNSANSLTAIVDVGATGSVFVTKPGASATLPGFTWYNNPIITSFSPSAGAVGTTVTISGANFNAIAANNTVYFGAVKAVVISATTTSIVVTVPLHATFEPISVTANKLIGYSKIPFLVTFSAGGSITSSSFANRAIVDITENPMHVALGDLDADGKTDVLITGYNGTGNTTGLFLYRNTSTLAAVSFTSPLIIDNLDYVASAVGDLDGDGKLDIAVIKDNSIATYLNTSTIGNLSFAVGAVLVSGNNQYGIAIADFDGDGKADVVSSGPNTKIFRNISNPGSIAFAASVNYAVGGTRNVSIADLNNDGKPDIISPDGLIYIFKNNCTKGNINFDIATTISGYSHSNIAMGDVDGDGKTDIISADINGSKVAVIRNTSTATTLSFLPAVEFDCTEVPSGISVSDLDGDGKLDIAVGTYNFSTAVFKNTSTVGNISFAPKVNYTAGIYGSKNMTALGDIDGNGKNDIVQSNEIQGNFSVHLNEVNASPFILSFNPVLGNASTLVTITGNNFIGTTNVSFGGVSASSFIVNSATSITATVGAGASGAVAVTNSLGTGTKPGFVFGIPPTITSISPPFAPIGASVIIAGNNFSSTLANNKVFFGEVKAIITAASTNSITATVPIAAGHAPITVTVNNLIAYSPQSFSLTFPGSTGSFTATSFEPPINRSNSGVGTLSDVDGDGKLDLVMAKGLNNFAVARNTSSAGIIAYAPNVNFLSMGDSQGATTGDLDGDGKPDVVIYNYDSSTISVIKNNSTIGNLSMGVPARYYTGPSATRPSEAVIHDIDGDGKPDIIVANYYSQTLAVFKNISINGNILFDTRIDYSTPEGYPTGITVRDINGDGKPELITSVNGPSNLTCFLNTSVPGTISFALKNNFAAGNWPVGVVASDIDGDAKLDMVVPNINGNNVSVFKNNSSISNVSFASAQNYTTLSGPRHASVADMDGDGKPDIVVENTYSNQSVSIFRNISTVGNIVVAPKFDYSTGTYSGRSALGDIDGDGVPDMVLFMQDGITKFFRNIIGGSAVVQVCTNGNANIVSNLTGSTYQWQQNTGTGFVNINNNTNFSGANNATLVISNIPLAWNGYLYRCNVSSTNFSVSTTLNVANAPIANAGVDTSICLGNSVQLNATAGASTYAWSPSTGLSNANIANPIASPTATTAYTLTVSNGNTCIATDNIVVMVNPIVNATINIATPSSSICASSTVTFTASTTNAGANPTYQWKLNGNTVGSNSNTYTTNTLSNSDQVYCVLTNNNLCTNNPTDTSNTIIMVVNANVSPTVNITAGSTNVCAGTAVTFTAFATNGGTLPTYQWNVNGINVGANSPTLTFTLIAGVSFVKVVMTSSLACTLSPSDTAIIAVLANATPTANAGNDTTICTGTSVQLNATGGGTYVWTPALGLNNANIANPVATPSVTTRYILTVTNGSCTSIDTIIVNVALPTSPSVTITTPNNNVCSGSNVSFTAVALNAGTNPIYQWQVNGLNAGTNNNTFTSTTIPNGGVVKLSLTSALGCAIPPNVFSNSILVTVTPSVIPTASFTASSTNICSGTSVTFTSTSTQVGSAPIYQWKKNNINVGFNSTTYTSNSFINGDVITLSLLSNATCASVAPVLSSASVITVTPQFANASIAGITTVVANSTTLLTASAAAGTAISYQWQDSTDTHNWQNIAAANIATLLYSPGLSGNKVRCILVINSLCASAYTATSNTLIFIVTSSPVAPNPTGRYTLSYYPNPVNNFITIDSLQLSKEWETLKIISADGHEYKSYANLLVGKKKVLVDVQTLTAGIYFMLLTRKQGVPIYFKFIKL